VAVCDKNVIQALASGVKCSLVNYLRLDSLIAECIEGKTPGIYTARSVFLAHVELLWG
jgi:hypothetical protein